MLFLVVHTCQNAISCQCLLHRLIEQLGTHANHMNLLIILTNYADQMHARKVRGGEAHSSIHELINLLSVNLFQHLQ